MALTKQQMVEMLENDEDSDLWLLNEDGSTAIVPNQDITKFQDMSSWPRYICRSVTVNNLVRGMGEDKALAFVNGIIASTIAHEPGPIARFTSRLNPTNW